MLGADDPTKDNIRVIIEEANDLGGYQHLSQDQQQELIDQLEVSRQEETTGITRRPQAQLQDARAVMERVRREVCSYAHFCYIIVRFLIIRLHLSS
jgi:hypothetical protein